MTRRLQDEIKQSRPFVSLEEEVTLGLARTADAMARASEDVLRGSGLTATQYNVLRILRGARPHGLPCRELGERMITRDPDVTRLLDRLETRGLVARSRDAKDRRVIFTRITEAGLELLEELDRPVAEVHRRQLAHLKRKQARRLIELLEAARREDG